MEKNSAHISYTHGEELWNSWSHAAGVLLGVVCGTIFLAWCIRDGSGWGALSIALYLLGMLGSYVSSTWYHALRADSPWKEYLRKWDHSAIYWHIAGSYSPITLLALREQGYWGFSLFAFVWLCAIVGTTMAFRKLKKHSNLETVCYVGMGLCVLVAFKPLLESVSSETVVWLVAEGVSYITGAVFYSFHRSRYMHTVFHFFVLGGTVCHLMVVWNVLAQYV